MVALDIAAILIFVAAVSRLLYHYQILPWVISRMSRLIQWLLGIRAAESVAATANILLGMTEAPLFIRLYAAKMAQS